MFVCLMLTINALSIIFKLNIQKIDGNKTKWDGKRAKLEEILSHDPEKTCPTQCVLLSRILPHQCVLILWLAMCLAKKVKDVACVAHKLDEI